jgi:hypothetical protein
MHRPIITDRVVYTDGMGYVYVGIVHRPIATPRGEDQYHPELDIFVCSESPCIVKSVIYNPFGRPASWRWAHEIGQGGL